MLEYIIRSFFSMIRLQTPGDIDDTAIFNSKLFA